MGMLRAEAGKVTAFNGAAQQRLPAVFRPAPKPTAVRDFSNLLEGLFLIVCSSLPRLLLFHSMAD